MPKLFVCIAFIFVCSSGFLHLYETALNHAADKSSVTKTDYVLPDFCPVRELQCNVLTLLMKLMYLEYPEKLAQ